MRAPGRAVLPFVHAITLCVVAAAPLAAQQQAKIPEQAGFGIRAVNARPIGDFRQYVSSGWGVGGDGRWFPGRQKIFALRGDLQFLIYGRYKTRECFGTGCRIVIDITTSNNIVAAHGGAELQVPTGMVRPYVNAMGGLTSFWTESSADGQNNSNENVFSTTNLRDNLLGRALGGGVRVAFSERFLLDISAQRHFNGNARYLTRDSFGDGTVSTPLIRESEVNMWTFSIGMSLGR